ncbi:hypothetical protein SAMN05444344_0916 [Tenacibaculum mesophilum]|nr:hypothetical protein SAMN05444344_0916 [Tenacibaculum mesophilum]
MSRINLVMSLSNFYSFILEVIETIKHCIMLMKVLEKNIGKKELKD